MSGRYKYQHLSATTPSIRTLKLQRSSHKGELHATILELSLEEAAGRFNAISYTWGTDDPLYKIWIDGKFILLRRNIWNFLKHYQELDVQDPPLGLWVDSICINQEDTQEKSTQVMQMRQTFQQAQKVLIWLGDASMQNPLVDHYRHYKMYATGVCLTWEDYLTGAIPTDAPKSSSNPIKDALHRVLHSSYWRRLWIIQEIALAQSIAIIIASWTINIDDLQSMTMYRLRQLFDGLDGEIFTFSPEHSDVMVIQNLIELYQEKERKRLSHLTLDFHEHLCKDPRDKVFGLLGLMDAAHMIHVDYNRTNEEVFVQAAQCLAMEDTDRGFPHPSGGFLMRELKVNPTSCATFMASKMSKGEPSTSLDTEVDVRWTVRAKNRITACNNSHVECPDHTQFPLENGMQCLERIVDHQSEETSKTLDDPDIFECVFDNMDTAIVLSKNGNGTITCECFAHQHKYPGSNTRPTAHLSTDISFRLNKRMADHTEQIFRLLQGQVEALLLPCSVLELVHLVHQHRAFSQDVLAMQRDIDMAAGIHRLATLNS